MDRSTPPEASAARTLDRVAQRWLDPGTGQSYRSGGAALRRASRDGRQCARLLGEAVRGAWLLDAPAGSGRLHAHLAALGVRYLGVDVSASMLAAHPAKERCLRARLEALPLRSGSVDWVLCCRFMHHLPPGEAWPRALAELLRVARVGVLFSFFDDRSWPAWRARRRGQTTDRAGRWYRSRAEVREECLRVGLTAPRFFSQSGWLSAQCFALCRSAGPAP